MTHQLGASCPVSSFPWSSWFNFLSQWQRGALGEEALSPTAPTLSSTSGQMPSRADPSPPYLHMTTTRPQSHLLKLVCPLPTLTSSSPMKRLWNQEETSCRPEDWNSLHSPPGGAGCRSVDGKVWGIDEMEGQWMKVSWSPRIGRPLGGGVSQK